MSLREITIALFCLFHMTAVGIESIPRGTKDPFSTTLRSIWNPHARAYVLLTSQWQDWSLFAPEPLTHAASLHIDERRGNEWRESVTISREALPWWQWAPKLKTARFLDAGGDALAPVRLALLRTFCDEAGRGNLRLRTRFSSTLDPLSQKETLDGPVSCIHE